jgi:hypothetical protein
MIPFDEIDRHLTELGKNRKWLAQVTGRSDHAIRSALAPNAAKKSRSALLQKALTDAIDRERLTQANPIPKAKVIELEPTAEEYLLWSAAFKTTLHPTIESWAVDVLNQAARSEIRPNLSIVAPTDSEAKTKQK